METGTVGSASLPSSTPTLNPSPPLHRLAAMSLARMRGAPSRSGTAIREECKPFALGEGGSGYIGGLLRGLRVVASVRVEEALVAWTLRTEGAAQKQRAEGIEVLRPLIYLLHLERQLLQDAQRQQQQEQEQQRQEQEEQYQQQEQEQQDLV